MPKRSPNKSAQPTSPKKQNQLRIIGGQWRGRKLAIAEVEGLRPTGDRIRETLFNWLMPDIKNSHCLDLFAGSGALGLECLSRGAAVVHLLEKNTQAKKQLLQHCQTLDATNGHIIETDSLAWLTHPSVASGSIDIAFIDPPFSADLWASTIIALENSGVLQPDAKIYIESPKNTALHCPINWRIHREKHAGQVSYRLYQRES